ncbi:hypothetical protein GCM10020220_003760 [Nonomuraea rubra]|uniref:hypothetical protein n=1 Tax=Nonomuraea rubra TaxID=46180 RepID=UPI0031EE71A4
MTSSELETPPLDTARLLAERGDLDAAARILGELAADPDGPDRAQAAVGLAVVLEQSGDVEGARAAARTALATGHPEYAAQAACHLAQGFEREGREEQARGAWQAVLGVGTAAYVPSMSRIARLAHSALCRVRRRHHDRRPDVQVRGPKGTLTSHGRRARHGGARRRRPRSPSSRCPTTSNKVQYALHGLSSDADRHMSAGVTQGYSSRRLEISRVGLPRLIGPRPDAASEFSV